MLEPADEPGLSSGRLEFQNIRTEGVGPHAATCWNSAGDTWTGGLLDPAVGGLVLASGQTRFPSLTAGTLLRLIRLRRSSPSFLPIAGEGEAGEGPANITGGTFCVPLVAVAKRRW